MSPRPSANVTTIPSPSPVLGLTFYCRFYCAARYGPAHDGSAELRSSTKPQLKGTIRYALVRVERPMIRLITRRS